MNTWTEWYHGIASDDGMEIGEQEFTFAEEGGTSMETRNDEPLNTVPSYQPAPMASNAPVAMIPGTLPVYNPATGTYGQQPVNYQPTYNPYAPMPTSQPYVYPPAPMMQAAVISNSSPLKQIYISNYDT